LHGGNGGLCFIDSVELDEVAQPVIIRERRLVADTEGAGRTRGAPSLHVEFEPDGCDVDVAYVCDGVVNAPLGVRGGCEGGAARQFIRGNDGADRPLPSATVARLRAGEVLVCLTTGGGGYGDPFERPADKVLHDVREGWITPARAEAIYGVALAANGEVDTPKTLRLREGHRASVPA